jgi:spore coat protein CotF
MTNMNQVTQLMGDKEMLQDSLISQKHLTESYNTYAGECVSEQLRGAFLSILDDEHRIQADIFCDLQSNGWYKVEPAEQQKIQQAKQKYSQLS